MSKAVAAIRQRGGVPEAKHESSTTMAGSGVRVDRKALGASRKPTDQSYELSAEESSSIRHSSLMDASRNLLGSSMPLYAPQPSAIITSATSSTINASSPPSSSHLLPELAPRAPLVASNAQKSAAAPTASKRSSIVATVPLKDEDGMARRIKHHRSVSALTLSPRRAETSAPSARSSTSPSPAGSSLSKQSKSSLPGNSAAKFTSAKPSLTTKPAQTRLPRPTSMAALKTMSHASSPINGLTSTSTTNVNDTTNRSTQRTSFISRLASSIGNGASSRKVPMERSLRSSRMPAFNETMDMEVMPDSASIGGEDVADHSARQMAFEKLVGNSTGPSSSSASEVRPASRTGLERTRKDALPKVSIPSRKESVTVSRKTAAPIVHARTFNPSPARPSMSGGVKAPQAVKCTPQSKTPIARSTTTPFNGPDSLSSSHRPPKSPRNDLPITFPPVPEKSAISPPSKHLSPLMSTPRGRKVSNQSDIDFKLEQSIAQHYESPLGGLSPPATLLRSSIGRTSLTEHTSKRMNLAEMPVPSPLNGSQLKSQNTPSPIVATRISKTSDGTPSRRLSSLRSRTADASGVLPPNNPRPLGRSARLSTTTQTSLSQLEAEAYNAKQQTSALIEKVISLGIQSQEAANAVKLLEVERNALQGQIKQMEDAQVEQVAVAKDALIRRHIKQSREDLAKAWDTVVRACQTELLWAEREAASRQQMMVNFEASVAMAGATA